MVTHERRKNRSSGLIILLVAILIVGAVIWSLWAVIPQISRAQGQVIAAGRNQTIQSLDGGEITEIKVHEGDTVKRGQLLVVLNKVKLGAALEESRARVAALKCAAARINAELLNRSLAFPSDCLAYPEFVTNQRVLYTERRSALQAELSGYASQKRLADDEIALNEPLAKSGDVAPSEVIRMRRASNEYNTQANVRRGRYLQELQAEFTKNQEDLVTAEQVLTQRLDALKNAEFRAPTNGIVKNVRLTTVGGVFRPGDDVLTIVPTGDDLIVEAKVSPTDRAFVKEGQQAGIKFDAYDSSIYGTADGEVTLISADTMIEQRPDGEPQAAYYRVLLKVDTSKLRPHRVGEKIEIQPGMIVTAEIKTGENTVFGYLTKPILRTFGEALGER